MNRSEKIVVWVVWCFIVPFLLIKSGKAHPAVFRDDHSLVVLVCTSPDPKMRHERCMALEREDGIVELPADHKFITVFVPNRDPLHE